MNRRMRTYYYAVFGAIGGLIGWQVSNLLGLSFITNMYLSEADRWCAGGIEHRPVDRDRRRSADPNLVQAGKSGLFSGLLGLVAGAIGLPLSEWLFQTVGAGSSAAPWAGGSSAC